MKIYFLPPTGEWSVQSGFLQRWEELMASVPQTSAQYAIVSEPSLADYAIVQPGEQLSYKLSTIRPLSNRDIATIVWDIEDRPTGRESGFYCSLRRNLFDSSRHCTISYPVIFNEFVEYSHFDEATLEFGFIGSMTAGVRRRLMDMFGPIASSLNATMIDAEYVVAWNSFAHVAETSKRTYAEFIRKTKFVLCPRGQGTESIRLFEVLKAGRIPIIISDDYVLPALQGKTTWQEAALFVSEGGIDSIPALVQSNLPTWKSRAAAARRLWEENFSPETIVEFVATNLNRIVPSRVNQGSGIVHSLKVASTLAKDRARPLLGGIRRIMQG
jgi:hypothetical protein